MSIERTCGTCKHKGEPVTKPSATDGAYEMVPSGFFMCALIKSVDGARGGHGGEVDFESSKDEVPVGKGAFVADGSGYYAALCVEDDFGCNKWEKNLESLKAPGGASR